MTKQEALAKMAELIQMINTTIDEARQLALEHGINKDLLIDTDEGNIELRFGYRDILFMNSDDWVGSSC